MSSLSSTPATNRGGSERRRRFTVDALFTDHRPQAVGVSDLASAKEIRLDRIVGDPAQPRQTFDETRLQELTESIRREGVLQPIVVRYDGERDVYVVIHGERRWRACKAAGLETIPAIVRDVPPDRRLIHQLMENIVRDDLNAIDRAAALRALKAQLDDAPWDQVADAVGIRRSRLFQLLGTEKLSAEAQEDIRAGRMSEKQSRALQGLAPGDQEALRSLMVAEELPITEGVRLARALRASHETMPYDHDDPDAALKALRELRAKPVVTPETTTVVASEPKRIRRGTGAGDDELATLLSAVAAAAEGGKAARTALDQLAAAHEAPEFDAKRLRGEVLALARTLARTPDAERQPGGAAYAPLAALASALEALLR